MGQELSQNRRNFLATAGGIITSQALPFQLLRPTALLGTNPVTPIAQATTSTLSESVLNKILHSWETSSFAPEALCEEVGALVLQPGLAPAQADALFKATLGKHKTLASLYQRIEEITKQLINPKDKTATEKNLEQYFQRLSTLLESSNEARVKIKEEFSKENFDLNQAYDYEYKLCVYISLLAADFSILEEESLKRLETFCNNYYQDKFKTKDESLQSQERRTELITKLHLSE